MGQVDIKKMVLFGAGKIGRSFIAQLFSHGGYEVVFVDISKPLIEELNRRKGYRIIIKGTREEMLNIENVRGVCLDDKDKVIKEVSSAGIVATSVGLGGLKGIFPAIAGGLMKRYTEGIKRPLDIIIAENMRNADMHFRDQLMSFLPSEYPFDSLVGLVETSIGKMVPIMHRKDVAEDMLQIFAEPYNTLILNGKGFRNEVPDIEGLAPKNNMKAWVDRKLFIHNLGHSAAAYVGYCYNPGFTYMFEVLAVPEIFRFIRYTMKQSAAILLREYPEEYTMKDLDDHIDDLLDRFRNKSLGDTVFRVGCDLMRKLGPEDRLAGAINKALEIGLPYENILFSVVCGSRFRAADEEGKMLPDDIFFTSIRNRGIDRVLIEVCRFDSAKHRDIFEKALIFDNCLGKGSFNVLSCFQN